MTPISYILGQSVPLNFTDPDAWLRFPAFLSEYLRHLILPTLPQPLNAATAPVWEISLVSGLAAVILAALFFFLLARPDRDRRGPLLAAAWISTALLPPLAATFNPTPLLAMRSLYMPSVGIALLVAWFVTTSTFLQRKAYLAVIAVFLFAALGLTVVANRDWLDDRRVYGRIIALYPGHYVGYFGMGRYLWRTGKIKESISYHEKAVALSSPREKATVLEQLGKVLGQSGDHARSLEIYRQVTILDPHRFSAWVGVGTNFWYLGRLPEAADAYRRANAADAGNPVVCYNLVLVLKQLGRSEEAARYAACAANLP